MKNRLVLSILLVVALAMPATASQITVVLDPSVPPNFANFQAWLDLIVPAQQQIAEVPDISVLNIKRTQTLDDGTGCPDQFNLAIDTTGPTNINDLADPFYSRLGHMFIHLRPCGGKIASALFAEGLAEGTSKSVYWPLHQQNPSIALWTNAFTTDLKRNVNPSSVFTASDMQSGYGQFDYGAVGGMFERLSGGNFLTFDSLIEQIAPTGGMPYLFQKYLNTADAAFHRVNGRKPSDYLQTSPVMQNPGPDGQYLYFYVTADAHDDPFLDENGQKIYSDYSAINNTGDVGWHVMERVNGIAKRRLDGRLKWSIADSTGKTVLSGIADPNITNSYSFYTNHPTDGTPGTPGAIVGAILPDGGYSASGCWIAPGASDCDPAKPDLTQTTYFAILRTIPLFWKNHIFVFANGPYDFTAFNGVKLDLVENTGDIPEATWLPGLLAVDLKNYRGEIVAISGGRSKVFGSPYRNPVIADFPSWFTLWSETSDTLLAVTPAFYGGTLVPQADYSPGQVVTLWGDQFCPDWPQSLQPFQVPLHTDVAGCSVKLLDDGDNEYPAGIYFISSGQINAQLPTVPIGTYRIVADNTSPSTTGNGVTRSNPLIVNLHAIKPNYVQYVAGAITYLAAVHNDDGLVTKQHPAVANDFIQVYCTGLGPTNPPVPDGQTAVVPVTATVTATVNGVPAWVPYAGLQGIFPGLYQINIQVPGNVPLASQVVITATSPSGEVQQTTFLLESN